MLSELYFKDEKFGFDYTNKVNEIYEELRKIGLSEWYLDMRLLDFAKELYPCDQSEDYLNEGTVLMIAELSVKEILELFMKDNGIQVRIAYLVREMKESPDQSGNDLDNRGDVKSLNFGTPEGMAFVQDKSINHTNLKIPHGTGSFENRSAIKGGLKKLARDMFGDMSVEQIINYGKNPSWYETNTKKMITNSEELAEVVGYVPQVSLKNMNKLNSFTDDKESKTIESYSLEKINENRYKLSYCLSDESGIKTTYTAPIVELHYEIEPLKNKEDTPFPNIAGITVLGDNY